MKCKIVLSLMLFTNGLSYAMDGKKAKTETMGMSLSSLISCSVICGAVMFSPFGLYKLWSNSLTDTQTPILMNTQAIQDCLQPDLRNLSLVCDIHGVPSPISYYEDGVFKNLHAQPEACALYKDALQVICAEYDIPCGN